MGELKLCPFCGGELKETEWYGETQVICEECYVCIMSESETSVIELVNHRVDGWISDIDSLTADMDGKLFVVKTFSNRFPYIFANLNIIEQRNNKLNPHFVEDKEPFQTIWFLSNVDKWMLLPMPINEET